MIEAAPMRPAPDYDNDIISEMVKNEPCGVLEEHRINEKVGWLYVKAAHYSDPGWVRAAVIGPPSNEPWLVPKRGCVLETARSYIGTPYKWGGMTRRGIDCSGLIHVAYREALGVLIPRDSYQLEAAGEPIPWDQLFPGHWITYGNETRTTHIAFYTGEGKILHATVRREDGIAQVLEEKEPDSLKAQRRKAIGYLFRQ